MGNLEKIESRFEMEPKQVSEVWFVDDDEATRRCAELEASYNDAINLVVFASGEELIEELKAVVGEGDPPTTIVIDGILMGSQFPTGLSVIEKINEICPEEARKRINLVAYTGSKESGEEMRKAGADRVVIKGNKEAGRLFLKEEF